MDWSSLFGSAGGGGGGAGTVASSASSPLSFGNVNQGGTTQTDSTVLLIGLVGVILLFALVFARH